MSMDGLPEELVADILRRLPPRSLAVCRSVCNDWRAGIDAHGMLLAVAHLVPRRLCGIFVNSIGQERPYFFSREPTSPGIDAAIGFMQRRWCGQFRRGSVLDHRNGLLLYRLWTSSYVCNPATRRWIELPERPLGDWRGSEYLMFDPTVSLHYDVLYFPDAPCKPGPYSTGSPMRRAVESLTNDALGSMSWPPDSYPVQVFSSRTGQWEEKRFVREDDTTVSLSDVWLDPWEQIDDRLRDSVGRYHAMYWREAFYLHCLGGFIIRFSLQKDKYLVIKTPKLDNIFSHPTSADSNEGKEHIIPRVYIGKSLQGIYYTALYMNQLRVWVLHEASDSHGVPEWELKHQLVLGSSFSQHYAQRPMKEKIGESWNLDRGDQKGHPNDKGHHEWDSDDDTIVDVGREEYGEEEVGSIKTDYCDQCANARLDFLAFHPNKEIAFLRKGFDGFAYYLSSSKLQYLGAFCPAGSLHTQDVNTYESFIYTPCMYDMLPLGEEEAAAEEEDDDDDDVYWM